MDISRNTIPGNEKYQPVCPKCESNIKTFNLGYKCTGKTCTFWIPREIRQKVLSESIVRELLTNKETGVIEGFHKRGSSETFAAKLIVTENWKIAIRLEGESALPCPKCEGMMDRFERGYRCNNELNCDYILWDRFGGKALTADQMKQLITEKRTDIIHGFKRRRDGKFYSARIIMKEEGALDMEFENR